MSSELVYSVEGMTCGHCEAAGSEEVSRLQGVASVEVDLATKQVGVHGEDLDDGAIREAIADAGYEASPLGGGVK